MTDQAGQPGVASEPLGAARKKGTDDAEKRVKEDLPKTQVSPRETGSKRTYANSEAVGGLEPALAGIDSTLQTVVTSKPAPASPSVNPRNPAMIAARLPTPPLAPRPSDYSAPSKSESGCLSRVLACGICEKAERLPGEDPLSTSAQGGRRSLWQEYDECFIQHKVPLNPIGRLRSLWDTLFLIAVVYVILYVPYSIAWNTRYLPWIVFDVITNVFFILDLVVNFHTSYINDDGELEMSMKKCAWHYFTTWFFLDLISSFPYDIVFFFVDEQNGDAIGALRALKLFRLLRVTVIIKYLMRIGLSVTTALFSLLCGYILICHWFGCIYWFIAEQEGLQNSWVVRQTSIFDLDTQPASVQYSTCIYWAIVTTATLGYGDITAFTYSEQVYSTIVILVGALGYALIIASVQQIVTWRFSSGAEYNRWMDSVVKFADLHRLPPAIRRKLMGYYRYVWERRKTFDNTTILDDLPFELRADVADYIHSKLFLSNPVFCVSGLGFRHMLASKLGPGKVKLPDDVLFFEGENCLDIVLVRRGVLELVAGLDTVDELIVSSRRDGQYCGDLGIFLDPAVHYVSVVVSDYSDVHNIPVDDFLAVLEKFPREKVLFQRVAEARIKAIETLLAEFQDYSPNDWRGSMRARDLGALGGGSQGGVFSNRNIFSQRSFKGPHSKNESTGEAALWRTWEESVTPDADDELCARVVRQPLPPSLFYEQFDEESDTDSPNAVGTLHTEVPSSIGSINTKTIAGDSSPQLTSAPEAVTSHTNPRAGMSVPNVIGEESNSPTLSKRRRKLNYEPSLASMVPRLGRPSPSLLPGYQKSNSSGHLEDLVTALANQVEEIERKLLTRSKKS